MLIMGGGKRIIKREKKWYLKYWILAVKWLVRKKGLKGEGHVGKGLRGEGLEKKRLGEEGHVREHTNGFNFLLYFE